MNDFQVGDSVLEANEVNLRWRDDASVGQLSYTRENTSQKVQRYVFLKDAAIAILHSVAKEKADMWAWETYPWAGLIIGRNSSEKLLQVIRIVEPTDLMFTYAYRQESPIVTRVVTPYLAWIGCWKDEHLLGKIKLVCAAQPILGLESRVCGWPFGNVYDDGTVCWGSVTAWRDVKAKNMHTLMRMFFDTPFNDDLWNASEVTRERLHYSSGTDSQDFVDLSQDAYILNNTRSLSYYLYQPREE